jgi:hypothetical protein
MILTACSPFIDQIQNPKVSGVGCCTSLFAQGEKLSVKFNFWEYEATFNVTAPSMIEPKLEGQMYVVIVL